MPPNTKHCCYFYHPEVDIFISHSEALYSSYSTAILKNVSGFLHLELHLCSTFVVMFQICSRTSANLVFVIRYIIVAINQPHQPLF